jgi:cytochrome d ubiquinol oxidase subunit I
MAMEGHFTSHPDGAPLILFGWPDQAAGKVKYAVEIPKLGSLVLKHSLDAPMKGLDTVPRENWPPRHASEETRMASHGFAYLTREP